jgi:Spy/CpxP family protein refolding chaperone
MITRSLPFRVLTLSAGAVVLAACATSPADNTPPPPAEEMGMSAQGLRAGAGYTSADVQTAYNRAQRIRDLLDNCSGAASPGAAMRAEGMELAQKSLGDILAGITPNTAANRDQAIGAMLDAQAEAYNSAVACGLVAPGVPDPGGWNATWDDISS